MAPYVYTPLDAQRNEIRLIKLLPGAFEDDVEIIIYHYEMVDDDDRSSSRCSHASSETSPFLAHENLTLDTAVPFRGHQNAEVQDPEASDVPVQGPHEVNPSSPGTTSDSDSSYQMDGTSARRSQVLAEAFEDTLFINSEDSGSVGSDSELPVSQILDVSEVSNEENSDEESVSGRSENHSDTSSNESFILNTFEALSYVWGVETDLHTITVRNEPSSTSSDSEGEAEVRGNEAPTSTIAVRPNLLVALQYLRHLENIRTLWIDAICINQEDLRERSTEVSRMGSIYHNAKRVVIWLGPEADDSDLAVEACKFIEELMADETLPSSYLSPKSLDKEPQNTERHREDVIAEKLSPEEIHAIGRLTNRPWFGRLWVYQEVQQARKSIMTIGRCSFLFHQGPFQATLQWLVWANMNGHCPNSGDFEFKRLTRLSSLLLKDTVSAVSTIEATKYASCLDDRDRVYSILSLLPSEYAATIQPDYTLKVIDVYKAFFLTHIRVDTTVELFGKILLRNPLEPSWVPDLADKLHLHASLNYASGQSKHEITYLEDSERLIIPAVHAATINYIGAPIFPDTTIPEIIAVCRSWEPPNLTNGTYRDGESMWNAFLTTITDGQTREFSQFPWLMSLDELRKAYLACVRAEQPQDDYSQIFWWLQNIIQGRIFFTTSEGHMGLCRVFAEVGDYICVALGCHSPVVLHPLPGSKEFRIRGNCFIHGLMRGEALLGSLPEPWKIQTLEQLEGLLPLSYSDGNVVTHRDPRLPQLPSGWCEIYKSDSGNLYYDEYDENGESRYLFFENKSTKEVIESDPRLTSEFLKARGVDIKEFIVV
jgi:hypothetical protein